MRSRSRKRSPSGAVEHLIAVSSPALTRVGETYLVDLRTSLRRRGLSGAVRDHDRPALFDWLMGIAAQQGVSDRAADVFIDRHGNVTLREIEHALALTPSCPRLRSFWSFGGCGYQKDRATCASPALLGACPLPGPDLRKGSLNQTAYSLALFLRDLTGGDLVHWIDRRLAVADPGVGEFGREQKMREALLEPLINVFGLSRKVWSMALAMLLLGGDPQRERWVATGASMIAIDRLVHNFLVRTGVLRRAGAEHAYGPRCYAPGGCADLIEAAAARVDARVYHPANPAVFPRLLQHAIWSFCAEAGAGICNGNRIDDRQRCRQQTCPGFSRCDRRPLHQVQG